ncbi:MAG: glycosyltransferase [Alphaproteobacteria bacterium]
MGQTVVSLAVLSCIVWLYLVLFRGGFWRGECRVGSEPIETFDGRDEWPAVVVVIPARNEADVIGQTVESLLTQDYPRPVSVILVNDNSEDGTVAAARAAAEGIREQARLRVVDGAPLAPGWAGKVWAMDQGVSHARDHFPDARYILFSDADIAHERSNLRRLVARAESGQKDLVSIMVTLAVADVWERLLVPPFVFFFQMLYPFAWVNDDARKSTAAAAGGCMLVRRSALERAGGMSAMRDALIDDCRLARLIADTGGRLWLGLSAETRSVRPYGGLRGVWRMVARSAYTQLGYSPWLLAGCVLAMLLVFAAPPAAVFVSPWLGPAAAVPGLAAYGLMCVAYLPTLKFYRRPGVAAVLLPVAAMLYTAMTIASAIRHWEGKGGGWKGRVYPH